MPRDELPCVNLSHHWKWRNFLSQTECHISSGAIHYGDVIMGAMASQITSHMIVCTTVNSGADQRKHQSSASLALSAGNSAVTGEFLAQRASNAENDSIWWRHHEIGFHAWRTAPAIFPMKCGSVSFHRDLPWGLLCTNLYTINCILFLTRDNLPFRCG